MMICQTLPVKHYSANAWHSFMNYHAPGQTFCVSCTSQESKEVLERLRRMDNFESQDFDTVVRCTVVAFSFIC